MDKNVSVTCSTKPGTSLLSQSSWQKQIKNTHRALLDNFELSPSSNSACYFAIALKKYLGNGAWYIENDMANFHHSDGMLIM